MIRELKMEEYTTKYRARTKDGPRKRGANPQNRSKKGRERLNLESDK